MLLWFLAGIFVGVLCGGGLMVLAAAAFLQLWAPSSVQKDDIAIW
jgi:hypothetical protein